MRPFGPTRAEIGRKLISRWFVELDVVAFGVFERCYAAPGVFGDAGGDFDAVVLQVVYRLLQAGLGLEGHDWAALDACAFGLAAVQAYCEAVGVNFGPVSVLVGDLESQRVSVEAFGSLYVLHRHPDHRYAF